MKLAAVAILATVACCSSWAVPSEGPEGEPRAVPPYSPEAVARPASSPSTHSCDSETECRRIAYSLGRVVRKLRRANNHRLQLGASGVARGLLCIHSFEGSWTDPHRPFWGGLQMNASFQRAYGGEFLQALGTADNWPPFLQVAVAMRAYYSGRGFGPWPNTRRLCGV